MDLIQSHGGSMLGDDGRAQRAEISFTKSWSVIRKALCVADPDMAIVQGALASRADARTSPSPAARSCRNGVERRVDVGGSDVRNYRRAWTAAPPNGDRVLDPGGCRQASQRSPPDTLPGELSSGSRAPPPPLPPCPAPQDETEDSQDSSAYSSSPSSPSSFSSSPSSPSSSSSSSSSSDFPDLWPTQQFDWCNLSDSSSSAPSSPGSAGPDLLVDPDTESAAPAVSARSGRRRSASEQQSVISIDAVRSRVTGPDSGQLTCGIVPSTNGGPGPSTHTGLVVCEDGPNLSESSTDDDEDELQQQQQQQQQQLQQQQLQLQQPRVCDKKGVTSSESVNRVASDRSKNEQPMRQSDGEAVDDRAAVCQLSPSDERGPETVDVELTPSDYGQSFDGAPLAFELEQYGIGFQEEVLGDETGADVPVKNAVDADVDADADRFSDDDGSWRSAASGRFVERAEGGACVAELSLGLTASPPRSPDDHVIIDGHVIGDDDHVIIDDPVAGDVWSYSTPAAPTDAEDLPETHSFVNGETHSNSAEDCLLPADIASSSVKHLSNPEALNNPSDIEALGNPSDTGALNNPSGTEALNNPSDIEAMNNPSDIEALNNRSDIGLLNNPSGIETLNNPSDSGLLNNPSGLEALNNPSDIGALNNPSGTEALNNPSDSEAMKNPLDIEALNNPSDSGLLNNPSGIEMLNNPSDIGVLNRPSDIGLRNNPSNTKALNNPSDSETLNNPSDNELLNNPSDNDALNNPSDNDALNNTSDIGLLNNPSDTEVLNNPSDIEVPNNPSDIEAPNNPPDNEAVNNPLDIETLNNSSNTEALNIPSDCEALNNPSDIEALNNPSDTEALNNPSGIETSNNPSNIESLRKPSNIEAYSNHSYVEAVNNPSDVEVVSNPGCTEAINNSSDANTTDNPSSVGALSKPSDVEKEVDEDPEEPFDSHQSVNEDVENCPQSEDRTAEDVVAASDVPDTDRCGRVLPASDQRTADASRSPSAVRDTAVADTDVTRWRHTSTGSAPDLCDVDAQNTSKTDSADSDPDSSRSDRRIRLEGGDPDEASSALVSAVHDLHLGRCPDGRGSSPCTSRDGDVSSLSWCEEILETSDVEHELSDVPSPLPDDPDVGESSEERHPASSRLIQDATQSLSLSPVNLGPVTRTEGPSGSPVVPCTTRDHPVTRTPDPVVPCTTRDHPVIWDDVTDDGRASLLDDAVNSDESDARSDTSGVDLSPMADDGPEVTERRDLDPWPAGVDVERTSTGRLRHGRRSDDVDVDRKPVELAGHCRTPVSQVSDVTPILQRFYAGILGRGGDGPGRYWAGSEANSDGEGFRIGLEQCDTCPETDGYEDGATAGRPDRPRRRRRRADARAYSPFWITSRSKRKYSDRGHDLADDGKVNAPDPNGVVRSAKTGHVAARPRSGGYADRPNPERVRRSEEATTRRCARYQSGKRRVDRESSAYGDVVPSPCHGEVSTCQPSPARTSGSERRRKPGALRLRIWRGRKTHFVQLVDVDADSATARASSLASSRRLKAKIERLNRAHQDSVSSNWHRRPARPTRQAKLAMRPVVVIHDWPFGAERCLRCLRRETTTRQSPARSLTDYTNMVRPVRRRKALPSTAINLWTAIRYIRQQKQIPNLERISRYMQREHNLGPSDTDLQLKYAVDDQLVVSYTTVGFKGAKVGMEQEGFKVPEGDDEEFERDGHDWYCFDCHQPGEVILCSECWRVYHPTCTEEEWTGSKFICSVCKNIKKQPRMKRKELNRLLAYTILRLKEKTKELHSFGGKDEELKVERFIYKYVDLNVMEEKTKDRKYKYLEQFYADARTIVHNTFICYGDNGNMASLAKIMIRDCKYDLDEIRQCKDCYHYSNAKPKDWFCQPCRPPHQLVYAKQKGFCYWPAKVIKCTEEGYDVRFFGGWHQRAILPENCIKPIDASVKSLTIKRTAGFMKAMNELKRHQDLIEQMSKETEGGDNSDMEAEEEEDMEQPEIKHKKFRHHAKRAREEEVISTSHVPEKAAPTPEDVNMVTSSEDNVQTPRTFSTSDVGVQTSKKLIHPGKQPHKATQTDAEVASMSCNCDVRYAKIFSDFKERIEDNHKEDKEKALKELEERLRKDMEEQKRDGSSHTSAITQRELDQVRQMTEDRCKEQYLEEIKKLTQKHKAEISATKKKQWCYNCEEEAMYHCCWNTSYCSIKCQQEHWHREHKRMCRRKRN